MSDQIGGSGSNLSLLKRRLLVLAGSIVLSFVFLAAYLFFLQVVNSPEYKKRARAVAQRTMTIEARRGEIFDRNYDFPLVTNVDSFAVDVIPAEIPPEEMESTFVRLAGLLEMDVEEIRSRIPVRYYRNYQPFEIKNGVTRKTIYHMAEHIQDYPGVTWHSKPKRSYLAKGSMSHVLGYVDTITAEEMQVLYNRGYGINEIVGKSGIEKQYDELLRGRAGKRFKIVDAKGKQTAARAEREIPPEPGKNVVLTIDRRIQELCERALGRRKGAVVVLKPTTGEILALTSYPWFDPEIFSLEAGPGAYTELALNPESPFLNRCIQSVYPPASVFKLILTTAAVEDDVFPVDETVNCRGHMNYGGREWNCWKKTGHGPLDLTMGLAKSCNIFFWNAGLKLGVERIVRFAGEFGLGRPTGIDVPGEAHGFLPSPEWKEQTHHVPWLGGDTMNLSIGQGWTLVTPLQIANILAMIVNDGVVYRPHLLKEVRDAETGKVVSTIEPEVLHRSYIHPETFAYVRQAMRRVVTDGTAMYVITSQAVEAAGKTGTGQISSEDSYHSWFTAFAPYEPENPKDRVVMVVLVEADTDADSYEWWSPKAGNAILQGIFAGESYDEAVETLDLWYLKENPTP